MSLEGRGSWAKRKIKRLSSELSMADYDLFRKLEGGGGAWGERGLWEGGVKRLSTTEKDSGEAVVNKYRIRSSWSTKKLGEC